MAGFNHLPNEIILATLEMVLPEDLENFAQTSKRVFLLAKPFLEHHRHLIRLHSKFESKQLRRDAFWSAPIPSSLIRIRNQPRIAHYLREVKLKCSGPIRCNDSYHKDQDSKVEKWSLFNTFIAQSNIPKIQCFHAPNERSCFDSNESYKEFLVALFLLLLPNLSRLSLTWDPARGYLRDMIRQSAVEGNCWFANLTMLFVEGGFLPGGLGIRDLSLFSSLPALKSLIALKAIDRGLTVDDYFPPPDSHTKKLELNNSYFTRLTLYWYLQSFQSLQMFTLVFSEYDDPCVKGQFDPDLVRATLVAHAKTTLQSLNIIVKSPPNPDTFMGSLQQFEVLQKLRTQWTILFPKDSCLKTWPSRVLPASIRKNQLDDNSDYSSSELYKALCQGLQCAKEKTCLHLDSVEIGEHGYYWVWIDEELWDEVLMDEYLYDLHGFCREIGISMTFRKQAQTSEWQPGSNVMSLTCTEKVQAVF